MMSWKPGWWVLALVAAVAARGQTTYNGGQTSACTYQVSTPIAGSLAASGVDGSFTITTGQGCPWTAAANYSSSPPSPWVTFNPASGNGTTTVNYSILSNAGASRSATLAIAGQNFPLTESGGATAPAGGGAGTWRLAGTGDCAGGDAGATTDSLPGTGKCTTSFAGSKTITANATVSGTSAATLVSQAVSGSGSFISGIPTPNVSLDLTTTGTLDWVHWGNSLATGDMGITRKSGGNTIGTLTHVLPPAGSSSNPTFAMYNGDSRPLTWTDGNPTQTAPAAGDLSGFKVYDLYGPDSGYGYSLTFPAGTGANTVVLYLGGMSGGGTLTATLGDKSATYTSPAQSAPWDLNYTLTFQAASPTTLTVTWTMAGGIGGTGNLYISAAALSGGGSNGQGPAISTPTGVNFSSVAQGAASKPVPLTVTNTGGAPLNVTSVTAGGAFSVISSGSFSVAAGGSSAVMLQFNPSSAGGQTGTVSIASNDPVHPNLTLPVWGNAYIPANVLTSDSFNRANAGECALGTSDAKFGGGAIYHYLPDWPGPGGPSAPVGASISGGVLMNNGNNWGGVQLTTSSDTCNTARGATLPQDLDIAVDLYVPKTGANITDAGPYFRSRSAAPGDGLGGGTSSGYWVELYSTGQVLVNQLNPFQTIAQTAIPASFDSTIFHTLEARVQGAALAVTLDGTLQTFNGSTTVTVSTASNNGTVGISFGSEMNFELAGGQAAGNLVISSAGSSGGTPATHFAVTPSATTATAGQAIGFTVTAQDANNNTVTGYTGTVHFTSTDGAATLPANSTLTPGTGTGSFNVTFNTPGGQTITATDAANATVSGTSAAIVVSAAGSGPFLGGTPTPNVSLDLTTTGRLDWVHWGNSLASGDMGITRKSGGGNKIGTLTHVVPAGIQPTFTLYNGDSRSLTWTDGNPTQTAPGDVSGFKVYYQLAADNGYGYSLTFPAGTGANTVVLYLGGVSCGGTLTATLGDSSATFAGYTFPAQSAAWDLNYTLTFQAASATTLTVTWVMAGNMGGGGNLYISAAALSSGGSNAPGPATHFAVTPSATTATAGQAIGFTVTAQDANNNTVTSYTGTAGPVTFTSSDANVAWQAGNTANLTNGAGTFLVTLNTLGNQTITATGTGITGTSAGITVTSTPSNCGYTITGPVAGSPTAAGVDGSFNILTASGCPWTATAAYTVAPSSPWIYFAPAAGSGTATVKYSILSNIGSTRSATIVAGGHSFQVTQPLGAQPQSGGDTGTWALAGIDDCSGSDVAASTLSSSDPDTGLCTASFAGFTAECYSSGCTYKNVPTGACKGGLFPTQQYTCTPGVRNASVKLTSLDLESLGNSTDVNHIVGSPWYAGPPGGNALGVTAPTLGSGFLNAADGYVQLSAGSYYLYGVVAASGAGVTGYSQTVGPYLKVSSGWSDFDVETSVFAAPSSGNGPWTNVNDFFVNSTGPSRITLCGTGITNANRVSDRDYQPGALPNWVLEIGIQTPCTSGPTTTSPGGTSPAAGSGYGQTMTYTFGDPMGYQNLNVVDILINNALNGMGACYMAYSQPLNVLYLVQDAGPGGANGGLLLPGITPGGTGSVSNSQCTVSAAGSSASGSGDTLNLTLNIAFNTNFGGNMVTYLASGNLQGANSGWQALGTWAVPATTTGTIQVATLTPPRGAAPAGTPQTFVTTLTDTVGAGNFGVLNVLMNNFVDGRKACYLAYAAASNSLFLVDDGGDAGGPYAGGIVLNGSSTAIGNSQCLISAAGSSAVANGNALTLTLNITFLPAFQGDHVVWVAGRDAASGNNTNWQAVGTYTVQ